METPFTISASGAAARRVREAQKALRHTVTMANQTLSAREAERRKKKEEEEAAAAAVAAAAEGARKEREATARQSTGILLDDDFTMDDVSIDGPTTGTGTNSTLDSITRNLEAEVTSPVKKTAGMWRFQEGKAAPMLQWRQRGVSCIPAALLPTTMCIRG